MDIVRAYSVINVKSIDEEKREVTGMATTPTTDRIGDIVESKGAQFALPIPLLSQHDPHKPIGHVTKARVTKDGIEVTATLVRPFAGAPPTWAARLDEAWADIKTGLVRGLSIGFKSLESEPIKDSKEMFATRFVKWLWLELSAVTIPANGDCSITAIKSIDTQLRAASGQSRSAVVRLDSFSPAGVSAQQTTPQEGTSMNIAEQIKAFEAKRMASADAMQTLMDKAAEEGRTLDEGETESYENAKADVKAVDRHLGNLRDLESMNATRAKAVTATSVEEGSRDRQVSRSIESRYITVESPLPKGIEFARYVKCFAAAHGNPMEAYELAKENYPDNPRIAKLLKGHHRIKAAVAAGTTTDAAWAGPFVEYQTLTSEFIDYLRPMTIIGKFGNGGVPALNSVPFNIRILMQTSGGDGYWVGEGAPKPLTSFEFDTMTLGFSKVANIAVLTDELVRFSNPSADAQIRKSLADALRARLDIDFIDPDKAEVSGVSPASITNGLTPIASSGSSLNDVRADLEAALGAFIAAGLVPNAAIMSQATGLALSMMRNELGQPAFTGVNQNGGTFEGLPVITSQYVSTVGDSSGSLIILLNTDEVFLADDGGFTIDASREASLQMDTAPTNNSSTGTATQVVSMWQTNSMALKAERFINWKRRRDAGVQYISGVNYTSVAPS